MRIRRLLAWVVCAVALILGGFAGYVALGKRDSKPAFEAVDVTGVDWGKEFALTDHLGRRRTLADFRGKVVALYFGYTRCPDMCPTTMAKLAQAVRLLGREGEEVQGLFITVDPKRDTPDVLAQYVPSFHPAFIGLYGDRETIARTAKEFKVYFNAQPPNEYGSYTVDHSGYLFVFDREGRLRLLIRPEAMPQSVAHDMRLLLEQAKG